MSPEARLIVEVLLLVASGASALVIKLTVSQGSAVAADTRRLMESVALDVKEIGTIVRRHGESLAAGNEKFKAIEKRLETIEHDLDRLKGRP